MSIGASVRVIPLDPVDFVDEGAWLLIENCRSWHPGGSGLYVARLVRLDHRLSYPSMVITIGVLRNVEIERITGNADT